MAGSAITANGSRTGALFVGLTVIDVVATGARPGEHVGLLFARALRPLIPRRYRAVSPEAIAAALLRGVLEGGQGVKIIESDAL